MTLDSAETLIDTLRTRGIMLCIAESCTGGLLCATITNVNGCSDVFLQGQITYANAAKRNTLGVPAALLENHGAVSHEVAHAMAASAVRQGVALYGGSCLGLATTGVAGPTHSEHKPIGLVYVAAVLRLAQHRAPESLQKELYLNGNRENIRIQTVEEALKLGRDILQKPP
ncbi:MAG: CinA family protein [Alphaproteobacteria bacterium]|nr:CinA family protein [Alphaproteobacteria bacterium]